MKETKRLYFDDPYQVEFQAKIVQKEQKNSRTVVVLDQTCFYPESGGQPPDKGTLENKEVIHVYEQEGKIYHVLEDDIAAGRVKGKLDWETRLDHIQQHAGQHILSQSFYKICGGETLSFRLGRTSSTIDLGLNQIPDDRMDRVERLANQIVFQDRKIRTYFMDKDEVQNIPLRKPPPQKGRIRVVEIEGFDYSACGGTHPRRTGEIGLIKVVNRERVKKNLRVEFLCGGRAREDYAQKNSTLNQLTQLFSVKAPQLISSVEKLFLDLKSQKKRSEKLQKKLVQYEADKIVREAPEKIIQRVFGERGPQELRNLALNIIKKDEFVVLFGLKTPERAHVVLACSENLSLDMRELIPVISPLIQGKGGGRPSLVELAGEEREGLKTALDEAYSFIKKKFPPDSLNQK